MAFNFPDYRAMAGAMQTMANPGVQQQTPGISPQASLAGSGRVTMPTPPGGINAPGGAGGGSTGIGDTMPASGIPAPGGGGQDTIMRIVQSLTQMLGRPPTPQEVRAVVQQVMSGGAPSVQPMQSPAVPGPSMGPLGGGGLPMAGAGGAV
jgi:hypothetical protein